MRLFPALCLLAAPAVAQDMPKEIVADLNGDGVADRAMLTQPDRVSDATLVIMTGQPGGGYVETATAPDFVWVGGIGQQPGLEVNAHGSLMVHSENIAIGRNRWHQVITVAWRGGQFLTAGFTYDWYDTLDPDRNGRCDINLLTGRGEREVGPERVPEAFTTGLRAVRIAEWSGDVPEVCGVDWGD